MPEKKYFLMSETIKKLLFVDNSPDKNYFYYIEECPICCKKRAKYLFHQWGIKYLKCKECSFIFSNPRLNDKGAYIWYNSDYYNAAMKTEHYKAENYSKYYSISLSEFHFKKLIELFNRYNFPEDISIADIGCGSGAVLHYLKDELGYTNITGYDLNTANTDFSKRFRNIEIENTDIYMLEPEEKFDVVITTENIEHISNPAEYVKQIIKLLKPDGFLFLTTPHNDKIATRLMQLSGDGFCAPNHQNYFNANNLSGLLNKNKFEVIESWIDDTNNFNLYAFIKRFLIKRDQVTAYPPLNPQLKTIWKWQKNTDMSIILSEYKYAGQSENYDVNRNKLTLRARLKKILANLIPLRYDTHQILVAKYNV